MNNTTTFFTRFIIFGLVAMAIVLGVIAVPKISAFSEPIQQISTLSNSFDKQHSQITGKPMKANHEVRVMNSSSRFN